MEKKTLHIISHSHWDREWYMGFEQHRARLVELMDNLITVMEENEDFRYFHLDGQMIVIEDYLQIKPCMKPRLDALIRAGRIQVGPWYVLQDEFLTSGESNVRNMLEGLKICKENGYAPVKTGYFPDAFGNISQIPQLLRGFGMDNAVFGRGMWTILSDNRPDAKNNAKEINWRGADGSTVIGILFSDWYNNANELPTKPEDVQKTYGELLTALQRTAGTPHLLGMNGCDHQPVQLDLPQSLQQARRQFGDTVEIRHSNFNEYVAALRPYAADFPIADGELTGQQTNGICQLVDTASTHIPLKQKNHAVQTLLTHQAEPLSVLAAAYGDTYRKDLLRYGWKTLMQNHPHDSICTCSCDAVAREVDIRFDKAAQVASYVRDEAGRYLAEHLNTRACGEENLVVVHTTPMAAQRVLTASFYSGQYYRPEDLWLADADGRRISASVEYLGKQFTYTLPKDRFRQVEYRHAYTIRFRCRADGLGCQVYTLHTDAAKPMQTDMHLLETGMENRFLRVTIGKDGTLSVCNKQTGRVYAGLHRLEDCGDCGDSYNFKQTRDAVRFPETAQCRLLHADALGITWEIVYTMELPAGLADAETRSDARITHTIRSLVTLDADSRYVSVKTTLQNKSENHRLRVLLPNALQTETVLADAPFDVVRRDIQPWSGWENPSNTNRMQTFFALENETDGLLLAGKGLHSYEVLRDGKNTMALTLLRAVGEMGDWGVFPTPDMQLKRELTLEYAILPYAKEEKAAAFAAAYDYAGDDFFVTQTGKHPGEIPANTPLLRVTGDAVVFSALKAAEDGKGAVLRLYNVAEQTERVCLTLHEAQNTALTETNLNEDAIKPLPLEHNTVTIPLGSKKIWTGKLHCKKT